MYMKDYQTSSSLSMGHSVWLSCDSLDIDVFVRHCDRDPWKTLCGYINPMRILRPKT